MKSVAVILILFSTVLCSAASPWQMIGGDKLSFLLPNYDNSASELGGRVTPDILLESRKYSLTNCPLAAAVNFKIFDHLVAKNQLETFINEGPGMGLYVACEENLANLKSKGPRANTTFVILPKYILAVLDYDDEVAAVIAHEISHILLQHQFLRIQLLKRLGIAPNDLATKKVAQPPEFKALISKTEHEADNLAALLMINAGYNPKYLKTSLNKLEIQQFGRIRSFIRQTFSSLDHGSNSERMLKIVDNFQYAELPEIPGKTSPELLAAKQNILVGNGAR